MEGKVILSHEELSLLLGGIDLTKTKHKRWYRKASPEGQGRPHKLRGCLNVSIDSGKSLTHYECASHSFRTSRSGTDRPAEEQATVRGAADCVLEERLRLMRIEKYGAGGEKLSQAQMQLFELEPVVSEMIEQAESEHAPVHRSTTRMS